MQNVQLQKSRSTRVKVDFHVWSRNSFCKHMHWKFYWLSSCIRRLTGISWSCELKKWKVSLRIKNMEFNYEEALKRTNFSKRDVENLRVKIKKFSHVPRSISDKKVKKSLKSLRNIFWFLKISRTFEFKVLIKYNLIAKNLFYIFFQNFMVKILFWNQNIKNA